MELYYIIAVTDADRGEVMNALFREAGLPMILSMPGRGTAKNEHLAVYGLGETPKTVTCAVAGAQQAAQQHNTPFRAIHITDKEAAQNVSAPVTTYALFRDGVFLTQGIQSDKKFLALAGVRI